MNEVIGPVSYGNADKRDGFTKPFSEKTGEMLDFEVRKMITYVHCYLLHLSPTNLIAPRNAYSRTRDLLTEKKADVEKVAQRLLQKEVLTRFVLVQLPWLDVPNITRCREDMIDMLGKRPFAARSDDMDKYLDEEARRKGPGVIAPPPMETMPDPEPVVASKPSP